MAIWGPPSAAQNLVIFVYSSYSSILLIRMKCRPSRMIILQKCFILHSFPSLRSVSSTAGGFPDRRRFTQPPAVYPTTCCAKPRARARIAPPISGRRAGNVMRPRGHDGPGPNPGVRKMGKSQQNRAKTQRRRHWCGKKRREVSRMQVCCKARCP